MQAVIVILAVLCGLLAVGFRHLEQDLRHARDQLKQIGAGESSARIGLEVPNRAAEELFAVMNEVLDRHKAEIAGFHRRERALRDQIANVSHDLRTPLTSILGYLQLLDDPGLSDEERRRYLAVVSGRARALQELITMFYDLARIEGGGYPLEREKVDLYGILSELAAESYGDLQRSGLRVELDLQEGLPPVEGDRAAAARIFNNLIGNALKHGRDFLRIRLYRTGDALVTDFSNGGSGTTQEDVEHVFDRFYTADKTRSGQNTGLGLSIVRALARQMDHEATAELRDGTFTIRVLWKHIIEEAPPARKGRERP